MTGSDDLASGDTPSDGTRGVGGKPARRWAAVSLRAAGTAAILAFLLSRLDLDELATAMLRIGLWVWLATSAVQVLLHLLAALKWRRLLNSCGLSVSGREGVRAHFAGLFANIVLPSIVGGDAVRLGMVARNGGRLAAAATAGIADRATDVVALIVLSTLGGLFSSLESVAILILSYATGAVLLGIGLGVVILRGLDAARLPARLAKAVQGLQLAIKDLSQRKVAVAQAFAVALGMQSVLVLQNVLLGAAVGIDVPVSAWFVAWPLAKLVALTPVSLGGLGVREGAMVVLLLPFGVDPNLAMAEALVWYSLIFTLGLIGGAISGLLGRHTR